MLEETLLHWETLTKLITDYKPQGTPLTSSGFFSRSDVEGQQVTIDIIKLNRTKASSVGKRSPSKAVDSEIIKRQPITLARSFEHVGIAGATLLNLRKEGDRRLQKIASDQVGKEVRKLGTRIDNRNEFYMASALQGSITDTIDGVSFTADYNFSASHKLTVGGAELDADTLTTSWDDTGAKISFDIMKICQKSREDCGLEIENVWAGPEVMDALVNNDLVSNYLKSTAEGVAFVKNGFQGRLFGVNWIQYGATYKDISDVTQRYLPAGRILCTPAANPLVAELLVGDDVIPTADKRDIQSVNGRYSYSTVQDDPASIKLLAGEVSLPVIYVPDAFFMADVID